MREGTRDPPRVAGRAGGTAAVASPPEPDAAPRGWVACWGWTLCPGTWCSVARGWGGARAGRTAPAGCLASASITHAPVHGMLGPRGGGVGRPGCPRWMGTIGPTSLGLPPGGHSHRQRAAGPSWSVPDTNATNAHAAGGDRHRPGQGEYDGKPHEQPAEPAVWVLQPHKRKSHLQTRDGKKRLRIHTRHDTYSPAQSPPTRRPPRHTQPKNGKQPRNAPYSPQKRCSHHLVATPTTRLLARSGGELEARPLPSGGRPPVRACATRPTGRPRPHSRPTHRTKAARRRRPAGATVPEPTTPHLCAALPKRARPRAKRTTRSTARSSARRSVTRAARRAVRARATAARATRRRIPVTTTISTGGTEAV